MTAVTLDEDAAGRTLGAQLASGVHMGEPIAKDGDQVVGIDTHVLMIPSPGGPVPTATPMPFVGKLVRDLCEAIYVDGKAVAVKGSGADNQPHVPTGGPFQKPPSDRGTVDSGSATVFMEDKAVARAGDTAETCNDPADASNGVVIATSTVFAG